MPKLWSIFKISVADTSYVDLLIDDLLDTGRARFAMPNVRAELAIEPNDPGYPDQWHLENDDGEGECPPGSPGHPGECEEDSDLDAAAAWNVTVGDPGIIISIIDSGIRRDHEDLQDRNIIGDLGHGLECYDNEDFEGHGTYAAGLIGATTNNDLGLAGVDWNCTLMAQCMDFSQEAVGQAILESVDAGALVLNMSFAWTETAHPKPECVRQALLNAFYRGVHPVAASGNFPVGLPRWPASYPNVISVGHVDCCDYGSAPTADWGDVVAPGKEVWTTSYGTSGYEKVSGSSFACPIAAGISSLLLSLDRGLNPALRDLDIHRILELTATDMGDPGYDPLFAWGRVNAAAAVEYVTSKTILNDLTVPEHQVVQHGDPSSWISMQWDFPPDPFPPGTYLSRRYEMRSDDAMFPVEFNELPDVWVRLAGTVGLDGSDYQEYDFPWGEVVSVTNGGCVLRTYVYEVQTSQGTIWWPASREEARFAYTVAGSLDPSSVESSQDANGEGVKLRVAYSGTNGSEVRFAIEASRRGSSRLVVYSVDGRMVRVIKQGIAMAGTESVTWDTRSSNGSLVPSGVYFAYWGVDGVGTAKTRVVITR